MCDTTETKRMRAMPGLAKSARRSKVLQKMYELRLHGVEASIKRAVLKLCRCL